MLFIKFATIFYTDCYLQTKILVRAEGSKGSSFILLFNLNKSKTFSKRQKFVRVRA